MKDDYTVPILTTSRMHCSLQGWENVVFELGSERVKFVPFAVSEIEIENSGLV